MRVAEFFAGVGLVRSAVERVGGEVVFANDIEPFKARMYRANFPPAQEFVLGDIRGVAGVDVPSVDLATASFPCTDLSLAGKRRGLEGAQSGMLWEFLRVLDEMGPRRPDTVLLENVPSLATSRGGEDLRGLVVALSQRGYACDLLAVDASWFVPQSRPRLFVIATRRGAAAGSSTVRRGDPFRPPWLQRFLAANDDLLLDLGSYEPISPLRPLLDPLVEAMPADDARWWSGERLGAFVSSLAPLHLARLHALVREEATGRATAYRRTRNGKATWEIRADGLSGCLRTARGGSSKQALVEGEGGHIRVRWMTPREYARLQGAPDFPLESVSVNQALFAFGDAVCVPAVEWVLRHAVLPRMGGRAADPPEVALARSA